MFDKMKTNLFIVSPNNSGSTFLQQKIEESPFVCHLRAEGQHVLDFRGPVPRQLGCGSIWTTKLELFEDESLYDWDHIKRNWWARSIQKPKQQVFVEKSPPNIARVHMLEKHFPNTKYIFLVRNPYAVVDGIRRQNPHATVVDAATHIMKSFDIQRSNVEKYNKQAITLTYEDMCTNHKQTTKRILELCPEIERIQLNTPTPVKQRYYAPATNMNAKQISNLTSSDIDTTNDIFVQHLDVLQYFGYDMIE